MAQIYSIDGIIPVVHPDAFVHETAVVIGDVIIGSGCYVGPHASLRGDFGRVILEPGSNLQDTCVMHAFPGMDTMVEEDGHVGHGAVLHGCRIGRNVMVGMNAVVMDGAEIGESSIVGALAFVKANEKIPPRSMVVGVPARVVRPLTDEELAWKKQGTEVYQQLAVRSRQTMRPVMPLHAPEPNRPRIGDLSFRPLHMLRQK
jgi:phenylacetic acid degradation protein